ncbi:hypothetical protein BDD12DRAFT_806186 [Trichophaea hybrida]|nr:hypothetical protein BDD12DRAFT_806186 [Trichophaea hybrida]
MILVIHRVLPDIRVDHVEKLIDSIKSKALPSSSFTTRPTRFKYQVTVVERVSRSPVKTDYSTQRRKGGVRVIHYVRAETTLAHSVLEVEVMLAEMMLAEVLRYPSLNTPDTSLDILEAEDGQLNISSPLTSTLSSGENGVEWESPDEEAEKLTSAVVRKR